jgi:tRNA (adenine57-N1/adenine58-N1)-methyltransferase catalytic subunit
LRDVVSTHRSIGKSGIEYRIFDPSLEEYVTLTRRLVTPVYPADANTIVSLLDLNVSWSGGTSLASKQPRTEILEAGTGHGGLTLHLARAIHAANSPPPSLHNCPEDCPFRNQSWDIFAHAKADTTVTAPWVQWKATRRAVLHSVEINERTSNHAQSVVRGFRRGVYFGNVDFHIGSVQQFLQQRALDTNGEPFLSHAILDMPGSSRQLGAVTPHLRTDAKLVVFNPSVTQIADCVQAVQEQGLPLTLERVLELGPGISGGREWDVRVAQIRAVAKKDQAVASEAGVEGSVEKKDIDATEDSGSGADEGYQSSTETTPAPVAASADAAASEPKWGMVCRPKVGKVVIGGGFVGVWRKMADHER